MKYFCAAIFAMACVVTYAPAHAAGAHGIGRGSIGMARGAFRGVPPVRVPNMARRIPAPLPPPAQPPVINGPVGPSGIPPMGNGL